MFLQLSWIFTVITGGGVVGCLSLDWGVFAVSSVFFPFLLIGPEGDAIFEVWDLFVRCRSLGVEVSIVFPLMLGLFPLLTQRSHLSSCHFLRYRLALCCCLCLGEPRLGLLLISLWRLLCVDFSILVIWVFSAEHRLRFLGYRFLWYFL